MINFKELHMVSSNYQETSFKYNYNEAIKNW